MPTSNAIDLSRQDNLAAMPPLRSPEVVMNLERLGSFHSTRLSFTRTLVRRMQREQWRFETIQKTLDHSGFGRYVCLIHTPTGPVSFIAFANELDDEERTDRVIAEKWDMCFTLFNGIPDESDLQRLSQQLPLQEAGRLSEREIVMSRANKSMRLFNSVTESLASGRQPNARDIMQIGYLVRTTAVYGNGKFGLLDFNKVKKDTPFGLPFQAEMLTVYMARQFSLELVEHVARQRGGRNAVKLAKELKRAIGVGNATGLGMAPFLIGHPQLIGQWIEVREKAIQLAISNEEVSAQEIERFCHLLERVSRHLVQWQTDDSRQATRLELLATELQELACRTRDLNNSNWLWRQLTDWAKSSTSIECQELLHSLILEIYPDQVNRFEERMGIDESFRLDPTMQLRELRHVIERRYRWALETDFSTPESQHYFWYVSEEKEEPRLGRRYEEPGSDLEMRVSIARDVSALYSSICDIEKTQSAATVADLLQKSPQHRYIVTRIQSLAEYKYGEIQENLLGHTCLPIDILRCKLAIFGATRFDPKSNLWTRITLFQGAPLIDEVASETADDWAFPVVPC